MSQIQQLISHLKEGRYDGAFASLSPAAVGAARERALNLAEEFALRFPPSPDAPVALFSSPGRTELGGNHTDHQHGCVLCGSVDRDMLAVAAPNDDGVIRIRPEGYPPVEVSVDDLLPHREEINTSAALVRGVAAGVARFGYPLRGFDACVTSDVPAGSGLSSSAAFEVLVGNILNRFCCRGELDRVAIAKIGQSAENLYFGKPCGLMDQMACSVGGAVFLDFAHPSNPVVKRVDFDFDVCGHALCIVDTGSCHADLTDDYAHITREMGAVATHFGHTHLRDVPSLDFLREWVPLRETCGDRAVLRALHFFEENERAEQEAQALEAGDFSRFLKLVSASGLSSSLLLQNTRPSGDPRQQAIPLVLALGERLLEGQGAIRVHGGGFAGTVQAFVPLNRLDLFRTGMEALLGEGACRVMRIRPVGACVLTPGGE